MFLALGLGVAFLALVEGVDDFTVAVADFEVFNVLPVSNELADIEGHSELVIVVVLVGAVDFYLGGVI